MPQSLYRKAKMHLIQDDQEEHYAFFLAGTGNINGQLSFFVKEVIPVPVDKLDISNYNGYQINLNFLLEIMNQAQSKNLALVEAHSHPFTSKNVTFSITDVKGLEEFVTYIQDVLPELPYAATVWGRESIDGMYWSARNKVAKPLTHVKVIGNNLLVIPTTSKTSSKKQVKSIEPRFVRQIEAIGEDGQEKIQQTRVAIVGLGGLGSQTAQLLGYLGVRNFILIDLDAVEELNLNRLIGAGSDDIGKSKVDITTRMIQHIAGKDKAGIVSVKDNLTSISAIEAIKQADIIFGCVDNDGARLVLNEISLAYMIPLIDAAVGITARDGQIMEAGGRVMIVQPDGPCLFCAKEISPFQATEDLLSKEQLEFRKKTGYVTGANVQNSSVVSLCATIVSVAVTEFKAFVTGLRPVKTYTFYDMLEQTMVQRIVKPATKCYSCSLKGIGDKVQLERYWRR